jgi:hypothetical protein
MSSALEEFDRLFKARQQPTPEKLADATTIRELIREAVEYIDANIIACREKSLALTKLQEATMWAACAALRDFDAK